MLPSSNVFRILKALFLKKKYLVINNDKVSVESKLTRDLFHFFISLPLVKYATMYYKVLCNTVNRMLKDFKLY